MRGNWRRWALVVAATLAIVLAVGMAGSAFAYQTTDGAGGWSCPFLGDSQAATAMQQAMRDGDFDRMQELMRENNLPGAMMWGANADAMREAMSGADYDRMQELMRTGDYAGMQDYMSERGIAAPNGQPGAQGPMMGGGYGPGSMMGGSYGTGSLIGGGGMMGPR